MKIFFLVLNRWYLYMVQNSNIKGSCGHLLSLSIVNSVHFRYPSRYIFCVYDEKSHMLIETVVNVHCFVYLLTEIEFWFFSILIFSIVLTIAFKDFFFYIFNILLKLKHFGTDEEIGYFEYVIMVYHWFAS